MVRGLLIKAIVAAMYIFPSHTLKTFNEMDLCNQTIVLEEGQDGGVIDFRYTPGKPTTYKCSTIFRTSIDYQLVLWFADPLPVLSQPPSYSCGTSLTLREIDQLPGGYIQFCKSEDVSNTKYTSYSNEILLDLVIGISANETVRYKMLIGRYIYRMTGACNTNWLRCSSNYRCVPKDLVCGTGYDFCTDGTTFCTDIEKDVGSQNFNTIIGAVCGIVGVMLLAIILFVFVGRKCACFRKESDRVIAAQAVITTQLATRGVAANNNDEEGAIDYSKFQDPPQYCSLENIHYTDGHTQTVSANLDCQTQTDNIDGDADSPPPAYQDVLQNQAHYNVSFHM